MSERQHASPRPLKSPIRLSDEGKGGAVGAPRETPSRSAQEDKDVPTVEARIGRLRSAEMEETVQLIEYLGGAIARLNRLCADAEESWLSERLQEARSVLLQEVHHREAPLRMRLAHGRSGSTGR